MPLEIRSIPRPSWTPLPYEGCYGVEAKSLLRLDHLAVAMLRFSQNASIHEHSADIDIDVVCLEGQGIVSVGKEKAPFQAGQWVHWPSGALHRLWTEGHAMITLMFEHVTKPSSQGQG